MRDDVNYTVNLIASAVKQRQWLLIDSLLNSLVPPLSRNAVSGLLEALVDDSLGDQYLFGIVHAAESVPDHDYIACMLDVLPALAQSAPRWTRILVIRVMNSSTANSELLRAAPNATNDQRDALMRALRLIEQESPGKFDGKCAQVRAALTEN